MLYVRPLSIYKLAIVISSLVSDGGKHKIRLADTILHPAYSKIGGWGSPLGLSHSNTQHKCRKQPPLRRILECSAYPVRCLLGDLPLGIREFYQVPSIVKYQSRVMLPRKYPLAVPPRPAIFLDSQGSSPLNFKV